MTDQLNEKLSAFLDDELELSEIESIRKHIAGDSQQQPAVGAAELGYRRVFHEFTQDETVISYCSSNYFF